jgi:hypothetical protein
MKLLKARKRYFETQVEDTKSIPGAFELSFSTQKQRR